MTDKQKPTPETDAEISRTAKIGVISGMEQAWQDMAYHAKELERQRDEAREELARAQEALREISGLVNGAKPATDAFSLAEIWRVAEKALTESTKAKGGE